MNKTAIDLARIGLTAAIHFVMSNQKASAIVGRMQAEGRSALTKEEETELDAESTAIHTGHLSAIERAEAEGR